MAFFEWLHQYENNKIPEQDPWTPKQLQTINELLREINE